CLNRVVTERRHPLQNAPSIKSVHSEPYTGTAVFLVGSAFFEPLKLTIGRKFFQTPALSFIGWPQKQTLVTSKSRIGQRSRVRYFRLETRIWFRKSFRKQNAQPNLPIGRRLPQPKSTLRRILSGA